MREILMVIVIALVALAIGYLWGREKARRHEIPQAVQRSRATLGGQFSEQVAPLLQNFPKDLKASEARFVGKPIDFLFFKGMDEQNITDVIFVEVKTGKSSLSTSERKLRDAIKEKRVEWREYRVPEEVTKRPNIQETEIGTIAK